MGKIINIKFNNGITQEFDVSDFTVVKNGDSQTIVSAVASGKAIVITISEDIFYGDELIISTTADIHDKFGQQFGSITLAVVNNNTPANPVGSSAKYQAIYAAMDVKPSVSVSTAQNILVETLVDNALWDTKIKGLFLQTPLNEQATTLNWINPSDNKLVKQLNIYYDDVLGFSGYSIDSSYMEMDFNPSIDGDGIYTNDEASIGVFMNTEEIEDHTFLFGYSDGGSPEVPATGVICRNGSWQGKVNEGTSGYSEFNTTGVNKGMPVFVRVDNDTVKSYFNGVLQVTETGLSNGTALLNAQFQALRNGNGNNPSDNGFGCLFYGGLITDADVLILYNAVNTYLKSISATGSAWNETKLADFNFEGSTYLENGYLFLTGGANPNDTSSPITGSQSLIIPTSGVSILWHVIHDDDVSYQFKIRFSDASPTVNADFLFVQNQGGTVSVLSCRLYTAGRILLTSGGKTNYGTTVLSDDTVYNVWVDYVKGSGVDSEAYLYISESETKPETPECVITGGDETINASRIRFYSTANLSDYHVDDILINDL